MTAFPDKEKSASKKPANSDPAVILSSPCIKKTEPETLFVTDVVEANSNLQIEIYVLWKIGRTILRPSAR